MEGQWLRGTCHEPAQAGRVGLLLGNSGWLPRSGRGDLYAHLADALALDGYWVFRFDMPGLGDSDGDVPSEPAELFNMLQMGGHGPFTIELARELKKRYGLEKVILGGHCGSATSSIYAVLLDNDRLVSGLMLMEIGFYAVPREALVNAAEGQPVSPLREHFDRARQVARRLAMNAPGRKVWRAIYRRGLRAMQWLLKLDLPVHSNTKLMAAWPRVMDKGLPTLLIMARPSATKPRFDFMSYLKVQQQPCITCVTIEGTTHSLLEGHGAEALLTSCGTWLRQHFPSVPHHENT
jgi:pimeloyl-ACP methyl ester carboxylesterase